MTHVGQEPALCVISRISRFLEPSHLLNALTDLRYVIYRYDVTDVVAGFEQSYTGTHIHFSFKFEIMFTESLKKRKVRKMQRCSGHHFLKRGKICLSRKVTVKVVLRCIGDDYAHADVTIEVCICDLAYIRHLAAGQGKRDQNRHYAHDSTGRLESVKQIQNV